jgi:hypothetical protein
MAGIDVQLIEQAPARFEVLLSLRGGGQLLLPRDHPDVLEIEELAYGRVLRQEVRPLPAGTIRVRVELDERGVPLVDDLDQEDGRPVLDWVEEAAEQVARRILA